MLGENAQYIHPNLVFESYTLSSFFNSYVYSFTIKSQPRLKILYPDHSDGYWVPHIYNRRFEDFSATSVDCLQLDWRGLKNLNTLNLEVYALLVNQICLLLYCEAEPCYGKEALSSFITLSSRFSWIKFHDRRMHVCRILLDSFKSVFV